VAGSDELAVNPGERAVVDGEFHLDGGRSIGTKGSGTDLPSR